MSMSSMRSLPKESEEDKATQNIIYGIFFPKLISNSIVIATSHLNKVFGSSVFYRN